MRNEEIIIVSSDSPLHTKVAKLIQDELGFHKVGHETSDIIQTVMQAAIAQMTEIGMIRVEHPYEESDAEKLCSFANEVVMLKIKANDLFLNLTCKQLEEVTKTVGWEMAEILKRTNKDG